MSDASHQPANPSPDGSQGNDFATQPQSGGDGASLGDNSWLLEDGPAPALPATGSHQEVQALPDDFTQDVAAGEAWLLDGDPEQAPAATGLPVDGVTEGGDGFDVYSEGEGFEDGMVGASYVEPEPAAQMFTRALVPGVAALLLSFGAVGVWAFMKQPADGSVDGEVTAVRPENGAPEADKVVKLAAPAASGEEAGGRLSFQRDGGVVTMNGAGKPSRTVDLPREPGELPPDAMTASVEPSLELRSSTELKEPAEATVEEPSELTGPNLTGPSLAGTSILAGADVAVEGPGSTAEAVDPEFADAAARFDEIFGAMESMPAVNEEPVTDLVADAETTEFEGDGLGFDPFMETDELDTSTDESIDPFEGFTGFDPVEGGGAESEIAMGPAPSDIEETVGDSEVATDELFSEILGGDTDSFEVSAATETGADPMDGVDPTAPAGEVAAAEAPVLDEFPLSSDHPWQDMFVTEEQDLLAFDEAADPSGWDRVEPQEFDVDPQPTIAELEAMAQAEVAEVAGDDGFPVEPALADTALESTGPDTVALAVPPVDVETAHDRLDAIFGTVGTQVIETPIEPNASDVASAADMPSSTEEGPEVAMGDHGSEPDLIAGALAGAEGPAEPQMSTEELDALLANLGGSESDAPVVTGNPVEPSAIEPSATQPSDSNGAPAMIEVPEVADAGPEAMPLPAEAESVPMEVAISDPFEPVGEPATVDPAPSNGNAPAMAGPTEPVAVEQVAVEVRENLAKDAPVGRRSVLTRLDDNGVWPNKSVPKTKISGDREVLTPNVGVVRVVFHGGETVDGTLHSVGNNKVVLDTKLGRISLNAARAKRIDRLASSARGMRSPGDGTSTRGLDRVRVRTKGGVFEGHLVAQEGKRVTLLLEDGFRITVDSTEVSPAGRVKGAVRIRR